MIYEIINPSDPVTLESDSDLVAAVAVLYMSKGQYGLEREDGKDVLPVFIFGGSELFEAWATEQGIEGGSMGLPNWIRDHVEELAKVFDTALVGRIDERRGIVKALEAGGGDIKAAMKAWNEERRTSLNDICGVCFANAERLRGLLESPDEGRADP